ncbi:MAG TPA: hypothetical protein DEF85_05120 [Clostridiaceae bacterium]|jgi:Ger(x)C family germination protein|nr:hypothetical protein [Clostridiaceae bacterium]HBF77257.1 hypothetical protein [Clostridiaceae bacterium]HBG38925.1 hypothetical protein [Clostridiaceae bacterium]HBN29332.1 hypothetical protein [Clostridiaceae bacterium]HBX48252.1 hypothetical protein [Clostridiaceae bacterium]
MKKKVFIVLLVFIMIFSSGCWDRVEIEENAFVFGIALDVNKERTEKEDIEKGEIKPFYESDKGAIRTIFTVPIPSKMKEAGEDAFESIEASGENIPSCMRVIERKINKIIYLGQTKMCVFTIDMLNNKQYFMDAVDFLERDPERNRNMKVAAVNGSIDDYIKVKHYLDNNLASYISGIFQVGSKECCIISEDLTELEGTLRSSKGNAVMPCIKITDGKAEVRDLALIKDYEFYQMVDQKYLRGFSIISNKLKKARKLVKYDDTIIPFYITGVKTTVHLEDKENLKYKVTVKVEGDIESFILDEEISKEGKIEEIKSNLAKSLTMELSEVMDYFQNSIGIDYLKIGEYTKKYHNKIYEKYEDNWDEAFKKAQFDFDVNVEIRRIGTIR